MNNKEFYLQTTVCDYLNKKYPDVLYRSDLAGIKLTIGQATQIKLIQKWIGWPDIIIYEPSYLNHHTYIGCAIEIKTEDERLTKKNGEWRTSHLKEQAEMLLKLNSRGFYSFFGHGIDDIVDRVDFYLSGRIKGRIANDDYTVQLLVIGKTKELNKKK